MVAKLAVIWRQAPTAGSVSGVHCTILSGALGSSAPTSADGEGWSWEANQDSRIHIAVQDDNKPSGVSAMVTVSGNGSTFTFLVKDVSAAYPIYIPAYGVAVTVEEDSRTYGEIEADVISRPLRSKLQQFEQEEEESYSKAAARNQNLTCETWQGLSRDIRIFATAFRGTDGRSAEFDWIESRTNFFPLSFPNYEHVPLGYQFLLGRGIGPERRLSRRLDGGVLPILHSELVDGDIRYDCTSFVTLEQSPLTSQTVQGTQYLVSDGYGAGNMLSEQQSALRQQLLPGEMEREEETVFYFRAEATNTASVPRYVWYKNIFPRGIANYSYDGDAGYGHMENGDVFGVCKLNGEPLPVEELAQLVKPGETITIEFYVPHRPIPAGRAEALFGQSFEERLEECRRYWRGKLEHGANIRLPEQRIEEMIQAGLLHLDLVTYGNEPDGTLVPMIGVYTAIGSESSPIVQFMDSMGWDNVAERSLQFFLDKQHENGFIQNFNGYMLETGAALWSMGEHYRYTRDDAWVARVKPQLLKAHEFTLAWRERNRKPELAGNGYGMLDGKVADPEDFFHSYMLNGYAYLGMTRLAEMLAASNPELSAEIGAEAAAFREDIRDSFFKSMERSPVVPLGDGSWVPTLPPWTSARGPLALHVEGEKWHTHGSSNARDTLLGPMYMIFQEVIAPDCQAADFMVQYHADLFFDNNVTHSQPYYSIHPWVHLKRGEVKPFLKAYYNTFSALADRETYTFWEHLYFVSPHKTHEEGWFLMQTRWMLYMEEEGGGLRLLPGIPRAWLEHGKRIELNRVATYYGPVTLHVQSDVEQGIITAVVEGADQDRLPDTVQIRLPHPTGRLPKRVEGGEYEAASESIRIASFSGKAEVKLYF